MTTSIAATPPRQSRTLFAVSLLSLFTAGVVNALRAGTAGNFQRAYMDPIDLANSATLIANALGSSFLGFTLMLVVTSLLLDRVGMKAMMYLAGVLFVLSSLLVVFCGALAEGRGVYWVLVAGMFLGGAAHAAVEGTVNPLMGSLYPEGSTHQMSILHAYFPAGLIVGGVMVAFGEHIGITWDNAFLAVAALGAVFTLMLAGQHFPATTSIALGVDFRGQLAELVRRPSFLLWFVIMLFTATMEIAPREWIDVTLSNVVGMRGVYIMIYVAALQFIGRHFAGFFESRLSTEGLLACSSALCAVGLFSLGYADSPVSAFVAATAWGLGVCYIWPVMLSVATDRYPRSGAIGVGLIGIAGSISIYFALPILGRIFDRAKAEAAGGEHLLATLGSEQMQDVIRQASGISFRAVGFIPVVLVVVFAVLWYLQRRGSGRQGLAAASVKEA